MRKHRFFLPIPLELKQELDLDKELSHYISRVLRLQEAYEIFLFNNTGNEYTALITNVDRNIVTLRITDTSNTEYESPCKINLGQVIGKGEKMDVVIQKTTELGVHSITPLYSEHGVVKQVHDRQENKLEHWQKIAIAASCQCLRTRIPIINAPVKLSDWIIEAKATHKLLLHPNIAAQRLVNLKISGSVAVLIGPEGGFSEREIAIATENGFQTISLGPRILRTETAGIVTVAILQSLFGDL